MISAEDREWLILRMAQNGLNDKRIGTILGLSAGRITALRQEAQTKRRAATGNVLQTVAEAS